MDDREGSLVGHLEALRSTLWRMLAGCLAKCVGMGAIDCTLVWMGHAAVGVCTACAYLIVANVMLPLEQLAQRRRFE